VSRGSTNQRRSSRAITSIGAIVLAVGALGLADAGAAPPQSGPDHAATPSEQVLSERMRGEAAIQALGDRLPAVADANDVTPGQLRRDLRRDNQLWVDPSGRLLFVDEMLADHADEPVTATVDPAWADHDPAQAFALHSVPGADRVIYLDFDGHDPSTSQWKGTLAAPYDADGDPGSFSDAERAVVIEVWRRVAEDFAPFAIDVTTADPGIDAIRRTDFADQWYGTRVSITPTRSDCTGCGGVAYVGVFDIYGSDRTGWTHDKYQPAWVYTSGVGNGAKNIAEAASHEAGHNLGLSHDGTATKGYYEGHGDWAPIMGVGYYEAVSQWSRGEYAGANNTEDDYAVVAGNGGTAVADDHAGVQASATPVAGSTVSAEATIGTAGDVDAFTFTAEAGALSLQVSPIAIGANLDLGLTLLDGAGTTVATADPLGLAAGLDLTVAAGRYTLLVDGVGAGDPASDGYSDYGSVGRYRITGSLPTTGVNQPPTADPTASTTTGTAPLTIDFTAGATDVDGTVVTHAWDFGDGSTSSVADPSHVFESPGTYDVILTVTDDDGAGTTSAPITVEVVADQAPVVDAYADPVAGRAPLVVTLRGDDAFDPEGGPLSYRWTLDGNEVGATQDVTVTITELGAHVAELTVTDPGGQTASDAVSITVEANQAPTADIVASSASGTAQSPVAFDGSGSTDPNGDQLSYHWDFGDGTSASGVQVEHAYAEAGTYTAALTVSDGELSDTAQVTITVAAAPSAPDAPVLQATAGADGTVTLDWTDATGADRYVVYRELQHKNGSFRGRTAVATVEGASSHIDTPGRGTFRYQVDAVNLQGSTPSNLVVVTVSGGSGGGNGGGKGGKGAQTRVG